MTDSVWVEGEQENHRILSEFFPYEIAVSSERCVIGSLRGTRRVQMFIAEE